MGVPTLVQTTYIPPNHNSALSNTEAIDLYIQKERAARRYTGPFDRARLENLIGPFRTSPL
ncbi:hypothetical protein PUNSTDRAFT_78473, partial [Punctularia strigosozonata HHB-11173 SS5]